MNRHDAATLEDLDAANRRIDELERQFKEAFPNGDYTGHCRYHEIQIEMLLARRRLIAAVMEKTIGGIVFAGVIVVGVALWQWFERKLKGGA